MNNSNDKEVLINYWFDKARRSINAAEIELASGNLDFSANRIYYAAFYAVTAALMKLGYKYKKHSAVRAAFHRVFIKTELVPKKFGLLYDTVLRDREDADYLSFLHIEEDVLKQEIDEMKSLIAFMEKLAQTPKKDQNL